MTFARLIGAGTDVGRDVLVGVLTNAATAAA
jgi:hypothetical protein